MARAWTSTQALRMPCVGTYACTSCVSHTPRSSPRHFVMPFPAMARHCGQRGTPGISCLPPCPNALHRLFRRLALGQRTRLRPLLLPDGLYDQQAMAAADDVAGAAVAADSAGAAGAGGLGDSALAAARMVEGMPRLSALDLSGVGCGDSFMAFLRAAQRHLLARQHMTAVAGYSTAVLRSVDPALLAACLPRLERFEGELPYACGAQCLRALARAGPLLQLRCSIDQWDEATAAAIGACSSLRGLKMEFRSYPETGDADISSTRRVVEGLLLPALAALTGLTSLHVASEEVVDLDDVIDVRSLQFPWPNLAPLAALTALQRLRLSCWGRFDNDLSGRLSQLPAGSLSGLTRLRLHSSAGSSVERVDRDHMASVDDASLAVLARAAPALQELGVDDVVGLDEEAPGSAAPWTMPHLTTLTLNCDSLQFVYVVCAAALLARAPRLRGLWATFEAFSAVESNVCALAYVAAAGRGALDRLDVYPLPPAAELQAATALAAPGGIALEIQVLGVMCRPAFALDDQQVAWLCSVVARVDRVEVRLLSKGCRQVLSRGIFALPAAAFCLRVDVVGGGGCLLEAVRFAAEAARPGQQVVLCANDGVFGADTIAEAEAIACCALDKDIRIQIGGLAG